MNDVFFDELGIPQPEALMGCGGGTHAPQTAKIMVGFEELRTESRPDAGLRSGDLAMPEEINRIVTDSTSDWFFVTEPAGAANLRREGKPDSAIHFVGHVMVDNLLYQANKLKSLDLSRFETSTYKCKNPSYGADRNRYADGGR